MEALNGVHLPFAFRAIKCEAHQACQHGSMPSAMRGKAAPNSQWQGAPWKHSPCVSCTVHMAQERIADIGCRLKAVV